MTRKQDHDDPEQSRRFIELADKLAKEGKRAPFEEAVTAVLAVKTEKQPKKKDE
jgi:hypothetical protein